MGMAGVIVNGMGDMATIIVIRVARIVSSLIVGSCPVNKQLAFKRGEKRK